MPNTPQFSTAEYAPQPTLQRCRLCSTPLTTEYYRVRGQTACASCADAARNQQSSPSDNAAFTRALLLGIVAAIVGLAGYSAFTIATSLYVGYVALGVGYIVARAMKFGSGGLGGRRYQISAVILTYLAIALAEIPITIWRLHLPLSQILPLSLRLLNYGIASPFLEMRNPVHGVIGAIILFIGLQIAWRGTAATTQAVEGPFRFTPAAS